MEKKSGVEGVSEPQTVSMGAGTPKFEQYRMEEPERYPGWSSVIGLWKELSTRKRGRNKGESSSESKAEGLSQRFHGECLSFHRGHVAGAEFNERMKSKKKKSPPSLKKTNYSRHRRDRGF